MSHTNDNLFPFKPETKSIPTLSHILLFLSLVTSAPNNRRYITQLDKNSRLPFLRGPSHRPLQACRPSNLHFTNTQHTYQLPIAPDDSPSSPPNLYMRPDDPYPRNQRDTRMVELSTLFIKTFFALNYKKKIVMHTYKAMKNVSSAPVLKLRNFNLSCRIQPTSRFIFSFLVLLFYRPRVFRCSKNCIFICPICINPSMKRPLIILRRTLHPAIRVFVKVTQVAASYPVGSHFVRALKKLSRYRKRNSRFMFRPGLIIRRRADEFYITSWKGEKVCAAR